MNRAAVIAESRAWIGTPWHHQATAKGVACDCAGVARGVCIALGLLPADMAAWPRAQEFLGYAHRPDGQTLQLGCDAYMTRVDRNELQPGDAVLSAWKSGAPQHVSMIVGEAFGDWIMVHASAKHRKVIEERVVFGHIWRFVQGYRLPGVLL